MSNKRSLPFRPCPLPPARCLLAILGAVLWTIPAQPSQGASESGDANRQTYTAPILSNGWPCGSCSITYSLEPNPRSDAETLVCWSCTFRNTSSTAFGGELLMEAADSTGGTDWVIGEKHMHVFRDSTETVADTVSLERSVAGRLRAPHWHLLCHGTDMGYRCGPVTKSSE